MKHIITLFILFTSFNIYSQHFIIAEDVLMKEQPVLNLGTNLSNVYFVTSDKPLDINVVNSKIEFLESEIEYLKSQIKELSILLKDLLDKNK